MSTYDSLDAWLLGRILLHLPVDEIVYNQAVKQFGYKGSPKSLKKRIDKIRPDLDKLHTYFHNLSQSDGTTSKIEIKLEKPKKETRGRPTGSFKIDWAEIREEYEANEESIRSIAKRHKCSEASIRKHAKKHQWRRKLYDATSMADDAWTSGQKILSDLKTDSYSEDLTKELEEKNKKIEHLQTQINTFLKRKKIIVHNFFDQKVRLGLVSDTHLGSLYERLDILEAAYDVFEREGIDHVYHCGDLVDGEKMYRGQEYELRIHGADSQIDYTVKKYPRRENITTHFIIGNHDLSFWKNSGTNVGTRISDKRNDMDYLGMDEADIFFGDGERSVKMRIVHPGNRTAYALSYHAQKYIESLSGGQKPHIICWGHYHKSINLPSYRNIYGIQAGCIQSQTPFMMRNNIAAHQGFWILEFSINAPKRVSRFKSEFFAVFEEDEGEIQFI